MAKSENADLDLKVDKEKSPLLGMLINLGIGLLLVAVNVGVTYFLVGMMLEDHHAQIQNVLASPGTPGVQGAAENDKPAKPPIFISLDPAFVVNFGEIDQVRYLQTELEVMTRDEQVGETMTNLMPMIRSAIILLLAHQTSDTINAREGMDALQQQILGAINKILETNGSAGSVEKVYFTSFVTQ